MTSRACLVGIVLALPLAGCGTTYKTAPVSGRVTLDGKALGHATVMFIPVAGSGDKGLLPSSSALTDEDGRYSLTLNSGGNGNGAVVGKHNVVISLGSHKQLPEKYNRHTTLECDVPAGGRDDANFDLKSK
jgi:hypothetical protein